MPKGYQAHVLGWAVHDVLAAAAAAGHDLGPALTAALPAITADAFGLQAEEREEAAPMRAAMREASRLLRLFLFYAKRLLQ